MAHQSLLITPLTTLSFSIVRGANPLYSLCVGLHCISCCFFLPLRAHPSSSMTCNREISEHVWVGQFQYISQSHMSFPSVTSTHWYMKHLELESRDACSVLFLHSLPVQVLYSPVEQTRLRFSVVGHQGTHDSVHSCRSRTDVRNDTTERAIVIVSNGNFRFKPQSPVSPTKIRSVETRHNES